MTTTQVIPDIYMPLGFGYLIFLSVINFTKCNKDLVFHLNLGQIKYTSKRD